ncbi:MAG: Mor transcription activator family protein [Lachnospiraceae bacterium]|nr:Mor transcription activator family protein [Lachnospiraceae bacterium]
MRTHGQITANDLAGIYKDIAEVIGIEATTLLHNNFQGQQITLPKKLYTRDFIISQVKNNPGKENLRKIAQKYGYTERRLRQILKDSKTKTYKEKEKCD